MREGPEGPSLRPSGLSSTFQVCPCCHFARLVRPRRSSWWAQSSWWRACGQSCQPPARWVWACARGSEACAAPRGRQCPLHARATTAQALHPGSQLRQRQLQEENRSDEAFCPAAMAVMRHSVLQPWQGYECQRGEEDTGDYGQHAGAPCPLSLSAVGGGRLRHASCAPLQMPCQHMRKTRGGKACQLIAW